MPMTDKTEFRPTHRWVGRRFLSDRYGQECELIKANRGKFLLRFADGHELLTVRGTFRRLAAGGRRKKGEAQYVRPAVRRSGERVTRCAGCGAALIGLGAGQAVFYHLLRNGRCTDDYVERGRLVKFSRISNGRVLRQLAVVDSLHVLHNSSSLWIVWGISPNSEATKFGRYRTKREARELIEQKRAEFELDQRKSNAGGKIQVPGVCPHCRQQPIYAVLHDSGEVECYTRSKQGSGVSGQGSGVSGQGSGVRGRGPGSNRIGTCPQCGGDLSNLERSFVIERINWT